jgi:hypothetical protein
VGEGEALNPVKTATGGIMKTLALFVTTLLALVAWGRGFAPQFEQPSSQNRAVPAPEQSVPVQLQQSAPRNYAVLFVPQSGEGLSFLKAPDGTSGVVPISEVKRALEAGYRPITVGDLVDAADTDQKFLQNMQKRFSELASDYDGLVARYNRLAAINSASPAPTPMTSREQLRSMVGAMALQSFFQRPPVRVQLQVADCTKSPALCVH